MSTRYPCGALLAAAAATLAVAGCSTARSASDYDTTAKFTSYTTFAIMERGRAPAENASITHLTEEAIKARLQHKGFVLASEPQRADFIVDFTLGSTDRTDIHSYPAPYAGDWFWDPQLRDGPYWGPDIDPRVYRAGILSIDVFDRRTHRPVWHGWSKDAIPHADATITAAHIQLTVGEVLSWFPPGHMQ
jgi:hypothetical protein